MKAETLVFFLSRMENKQITVEILPIKTSSLNVAAVHQESSHPVTNTLF